MTGGMYHHSGVMTMILFGGGDLFYIDWSATVPGCCAERNASEDACAPVHNQ